MFWRKKKEKNVRSDFYDPAGMRPVIHASICTGEQVAGFKELQTGRFREVMLIRDPSDLERFCAQYDIEVSEISKEY